MNYSWRTEFAPPVAVLGTPEAQRYTALAEAMPGPYPFDWLVMARPLQTLQQPPATLHEKALLPDNKFGSTHWAGSPSPSSALSPILRLAGESTLAVEVVDAMDEHRIEQVKAINAANLPVTFPDWFYEEALEDSRLTKLAYEASDEGRATNTTSTCACGAVVAKLVPDPPGERLYIRSIATDPAKRRLGVGSAMIRALIETVQDPSYHDTFQAVTALELHVHIANVAAQRFYDALGFVTVEKVSNYCASIYHWAATSHVRSHSIVLLIRCVSLQIPIP